MASQSFPGDLALPQTAESIHQVEVGGFQFIGCEIKNGENIVAFTLAPLPTDLVLLPATEVAPVNATIFWSGKMLDTDKKTDVRAYRVHAASALAAALVASPVAAPMGGVAVAPTVSILSRKTVVDRALSAVDSDTAYTLEDKINPKLAAEHWPPSGMRTDCSSFVAWCLRLSSKVPHPLYVKVNGGWFETRTVYEDGLRETGFFSKATQAQPGSLLVYGDHDGKQGHMGIVVRADGPGIAGVREVVHCSRGNFNKNGRAIQRTDAAVWMANAATIIVDYDGFV